MDDCDQNKILKISKTLWQDTASTNVNITNKHGVRAGARAVTIGICNFYEMAVDLKPESIRRRVFVLLWQDSINNMSSGQQQAAKKYMEQYLKEFKAKAICFFKNLDFNLDHTFYFEKLIKMYSKFTNVRTLQKIVPQTMLRFQTIILHMTHVSAREIVLFDENIIDSTFQHIIQQTFKVSNIFHLNTITAI